MRVIKFSRPPSVIRHVSVILGSLALPWEKTHVLY